MSFDKGIARAMRLIRERKDPMGLVMSEQMRQRDWELTHMRIADELAQMSHDPKHRVGCRIVGADNRIISEGINGLPPGSNDESINALWGIPQGAAVGAKVFVTLPPCGPCCSLLARAQVRQVTYKAWPEGAGSSWRESCAEGKAFLEYHNVIVEEWK